MSTRSQKIDSVCEYSYDSCTIFYSKKNFFYVERDENDVIAVSGLIHILLNQRDPQIFSVVPYTLADIAFAFVLV